MMSLAKLLVLALVIFACIVFAKRLGGGKSSGKDRIEEEPSRRQTPSETLVKCPVCGVFRPEGLTEPCERSDCPHKS